MRKSIFLALLLTATGCSAEPIRYINASADYSKPGAPVELKYALMKTPAAGSPTSVALLLSSRVPVNQITTRVTVSNGMQLSKAAPALSSQQLKAQAPLEDRIEFTPSANGRYYINVFVETEVDGNKLMRAFAIPVQVGPVSTETKPAPKTDAQGNPIIEMPAEQR